MNNRFPCQWLILIVLLVGTMLGGCQRTTHDPVIILHTNDTHSQLEPYKEKDGSFNGGALRRMQVINEIREENRNVFLFDAGDFSQGTPYYNLFGGYPEIQLMNAMQYDAATLGNHEFDAGCHNLAQRLQTADFPIVCSNYIFQHPDLARLVKPYVIIERNNLKIGVLGLSIQLDGLVSAPHLMDSIRYVDAITAARETVATLKAQGCDRIVCLSHLGITPDDTTPDRPTCDLLLAQQVPDINLIIGGHTHEAIDTVVGNVHIVANLNQGRTIGKFTWKR